MFLVSSLNFPYLHFASKDLLRPVVCGVGGWTYMLIGISSHTMLGKSL